jgi:hypothetical protein
MIAVVGNPYGRKMLVCQGGRFALKLSAISEDGAQPAGRQSGSGAKFVLI